MVKILSIKQFLVAVWYFSSIWRNSLTSSYNFKEFFYLFSELSNFFFLFWENHGNILYCTIYYSEIYRFLNVVLQITIQMLLEQETSCLIEKSKTILLTKD